MARTETGEERGSTPGLPASLAARIARDLAAPPPPRAGTRSIGLRLALLLVATQLVGVALVFAIGMRAGPELVLVLPALGATAALAAGAVALGREAIPGRGPAALAWAVAFALGAVTFAALVFWQDRATPAAHAAPPVTGCLVIGLALGLVPLALGLLAVRRGHAVRPVLAGTAMGVLGGVVGLTTVHLHCPGAGWAHAGLAHGAVVVVLGVVGAMVGRSALGVRRARD